jgi:hypothetical protein
MSLVVNFVGIMFFDGDGRDVGPREVLIVDGSNHGDGIAPHLASISIDPDRVIDSAGWTHPETKENMVRTRTIDLREVRELSEKLQLRTGSAVAYSPRMTPEPDDDSPTMVAEAVRVSEFVIPPGTRNRITITGITGKGVDATAHNGRLPRLRDLKPPVFVNLATAQTNARLTISNGTLEATRLVTETGNGAIVSRLRVEEDLGPITIEVKDEDTNDVRTIRVEDGTEIVIANISTEKDLPNNPKETAHFQLYRRLAPERNKALIVNEPVVPAGVTDLMTDHPFFADPFDQPEERCSNTCCKP